MAEIKEALEDEVNLLLSLIPLFDCAVDLRSIIESFQRVFY